MFGTPKTADALSARRARVLVAVSIIYFSQQLAYFGQSPGDRAVDTVRVMAWVLLSMVILGVLLTNGNWFMSKEMREILDDEVTQMHRARSIRIALTATMLSGFAFYAFAPSLAWGVRETIHALVTIGMGAGLAALATQEWRSNRDG